MVHGSDGLDELTVTGVTHVAELRDGQIRTFDVSPEDVGLARAQPQDLKGGDADVNAAALRRVLQGEVSAYRDVVLINAAAGLVVADQASDLADGVALARRSIESGAAADRLDRLVKVSNASGQ